MTTDVGRRYLRGLLRHAGSFRIVAFYGIVVALLALMPVFLGDTLAFLFTAWIVNEPRVHHLHELAFVTMLWTVVAGLLVQLHEPERQVAGIQQALFVTVVITGANVLTGFFYSPALLLGGLLLGAFLLHPAGRDVLRVRTAGSVSPILVGLVVLASIPLSVYSVDQ